MNQINDHHATVDTVADHNERQQRDTRRFAFEPFNVLDRIGNSAMEAMCGYEPVYAENGDEVLDGQAPAPCDPAEAADEQPFVWGAVAVVAAVAFVSLVGWAGWVAWRLA